MTNRTMNANRGDRLAASRPGSTAAPTIEGKGNGAILAPAAETQHHDGENNIFAEYPELLTTDHVAAILGVCRATVQALCRQGEIPNVKVGNRVYIPKTRLIRKLGLEPSTN